MRPSRPPFMLIALAMLAIGTLFAAWGWTLHQRGGGMGMMQHMPMMGRQSSLPHHAPEALSRYGCMSCHALDRGRTGPAFRWVAWKYHGQPDAVPRLTAFIEHGGSSTWGGFMPNLNVPSGQAQGVAQWILELKPETPPQNRRGR